MVFNIGLIESYNLFVESLPPIFGNFLSLFILVLLISLYSVFIWKFYRWIATKNILELNLNKFNNMKHPAMTKFIAGCFYLLEYIIILPFLIFFWFAIFTFFLIALTENLSVNALLIISATIIAAIRMVAYYKEDLAKEIAKLLPFTLLAVSIADPNFFDLERIITQVSQVPEYFSPILSYLGFIILLEIILRLFDFLFSIMGINDPQEEEKKIKED